VSGEPSRHVSAPTLSWIGGVSGHLRLIDQTRLPTELVFVDCDRVELVWEAIRALCVRGAPAIGIAAAYGVVLGMRAMDGHDVSTSREERLEQVLRYLGGSRPTAVNLFWALDRMRAKAMGLRDRSSAELLHGLLDEARQIHEEDRRVCRQIGQVGAGLLQQVQGVLTHCNAGGLATSEYGTALAVIFAAHEQGVPLQVYVDETRPLLQGARLTTWELLQRGIATTLICDSMAAQVMREGRVQAVITGADRIAANGDTANKIGTYGLAILAHAHQIPFYVAAPRSTFDLSLTSGEDIPIEQRSSQEVTHGFGPAVAPEGVQVYNPAFDVTPARFIRACITEYGLIEPVSAPRIQEVFHQITSAVKANQS
jgi:methylthioribose-1-phosphate isomerase